MNDEHDADPDIDPDLDPAQDARIRALLAELGSGPDGEPLPPEVAARLDDTLALLVAERGRTGGAAPEDEATSNVVPLRRRWLPRAAGVAAAVIVLGAGGVFVANLGQMTQGETSASDSGGNSKAEAPESSGESAGGSSSDSESGTGTGAAALPELSATTFASDVTTLVKGRALLRTPAGETAGDKSTQQNREDAKSAAPDALVSRSCPGPKVTDGAVPNPVLYDGEPAVLLVHPERAGRQLVEAWSCAGDRKLASTTVEQ